jgi:glycosyltransferase involved in cell wall biosynthesis
MKRILQIDNYMYPHIGGIEQVTRDILNALKDEYEMKVICFNHEKGTITDQVDGIDVTRVNCQAKIQSQSIALGYGKALKKLMKSYNPEIVIFHYPNPFVAHFLKKYLKKKQFKFILWWHLDITKQKLLGKLFNGQTIKLLKYADKIIATSPNYIEGSPYLSEYKNKCIVIPNCVNEDRLKYEKKHIDLANEIKSKYANKKILFGFGRHVEYKGLTYLVKASKELDDSYVTLIGGSGPLTESLKEEKKLQNNFKKQKFKHSPSINLQNQNLNQSITSNNINDYNNISSNISRGSVILSSTFFKDIKDLDGENIIEDENN